MEWKISRGDEDGDGDGNVKNPEQKPQMSRQSKTLKLVLLSSSPRIQQATTPVSKADSPHTFKAGFPRSPKWSGKYSGWVRMGMGMLDQPGVAPE